MGWQKPSFRASVIVRNSILSIDISNFGSERTLLLTSFTFKCCKKGKWVYLNLNVAAILKEVANS